MLTEKQISTKIASIKRRNDTLRSDVHEILLQLAGHAYEHGRVTKYDVLFAATKGQDQEAIARWIGEYGFARLDKDGRFKSNATARKECDLENGDDVIELLRETAPKWYEGVPDAQTIARKLDVAAQLESIAKRVMKAQNDDRDVDVDLHAIQHAFENVVTAVKAYRDNKASKAA